jgi:hypothetical protein
MAAKEEKEKKNRQAMLLSLLVYVLREITLPYGCIKAS